MEYSRTNINRFSIVTQIMNKVEKLNKRAKKLGVSELKTLVDIEDRMVYPIINEIERKDLPKISKKFYSITVYGEPVCLSDWVFVGRIEKRGEENIFKSIPGETSLHKTYSSVNTTRCDHCCTKHNRKAVYIVRHKDGTEKVVGSSCIKDFLGHDPGKALWAWEKLSNLSDEFDGYGSYGTHVQDFETDIVLAVTNAIIRVDGWVSVTRSQESTSYNGEFIPATRSLVQQYFIEPAFIGRNAFEDRKLYKEWKNSIQVTSEDIETVQAARKWLNEQDPSDYIHNLKVLTNLDMTIVDDFGFVCSLMGSYSSYLNRQFRENDIEKVQKEKKSNEFFGEIKKRYKNKNLIFKYSSNFSNFYGIGTRLVFEDESGNQFVWFNYSSDPAFEENQNIVLTFTIKDHNEYKNRKNTVINRVKVIENEC